MRSTNCSKKKLLVTKKKKKLESCVLFLDDLNTSQPYNLKTKSNISLVQDMFKNSIEKKKQKKSIHTK